MDEEHSDEKLLRGRFEGRKRPKLVGSHPGEASTESPDVQLPDQMKRTLVIESPSKRATKQVLLAGFLEEDLEKEDPKKSEIWGVGDVDENPNDVDDWEDLPEGWGENVER